jgi:hypothetical protein
MLARYLSRVSEQYTPGIDLTVVFMDTHVRLNQVSYSPSHLKDLSNLFKGIFENYSGLSVKLNASSDLLGFTPTKDGFAEFEMLAHRVESSTLDSDVLCTLSERAEKYSQNSLDSKTVAKLYFELCKMEVEPLGERFSNHIFLTYNHICQREFSVPTGLPPIPIYSLPKNLTDKPWNVDSERAANISYRYRREHQQTA